MDERHWWFASKLQETFHFGGYDNPTVLEDFLSDPEVVDLINDFLAPGDPRKLFFYCDAPPRDGSRTPSASRRLHATSELTSDAVNRGKVCLYVLRTETDGEVEAAQMERELFCGELRHSVLSSLASLLSEAYTPLLHSQKHWGECSDSAVKSFLQNFDKFSSALLDAATLTQIRHPLLQRPSHELRAELQNVQGRHALSVETVGECEALVGEWIHSTEELLLEATDERMEDPQSSPLSELSKWRQRHCLLLSVVEQLKVKETRAVFTALVTAKSRTLRKWKNIDTQLTDAFNNARDRVCYLESLSPHLEALEANPPLPSILSSLLTAISTSVKQMEGLSRAYARSGYLGILFTKISNALVRICTRSLLNYCTRQDDKDMFWDVLFSTVQAQIKSGPSQIDHPFLTQLSLCLQVAAVFKETLHHLKDVLVVQRHASFSTSPHSVAHSSASLSDTKRGSATPTNPLVGGKKKGSELTTDKKMSTSSAFASQSNTSACISGVTLHNVDQIAASVDEMSSRLTQVVDVVSTLSTFHNLVGGIRGLPRVSGLWVAATSTAESSLGDANKREVPIEGSVTTSDYLEQMFGPKTYPLEEEEKIKEQIPSPSSPSSPPPSPSSPSDSIALHIHSSLASISTSLSTSCQRGVHDVLCISGKARLVFPTAHGIYSTQVATLEKDISNYLKTVVSRAVSAKTALDMIARFDGVSDRGAIKEAVLVCTKTAFEKYSTELKEVHANYERNKGHPPISHSMPPIAGTLSWCQEMLQRVSEPMENFRGNSTVMQSVSSQEVCILHNRLSTALLQHEAFLIRRWHSAIESAQAALGMPLLIQGINKREGGLPRITLNCQQCLLDVMAESKALSAAGISLPEVAKHILAQELRVKQFRQALQQVLEEFYRTLDSLDPPLQSLLSPHTDNVIRCMMPGCSSLTWSTLNIDAFLHRASSAVSVFQTTASRIQSILREHVYSVLEGIAKSSLYDVELASSKCWKPREFSDAMKSSIVKSATSLLKQAANIRRAVLAAIAIVGGDEDVVMADLKGNLLLAGLCKGRESSKEESQGSFRHSSKQSAPSTRVTPLGSSRGGEKEEGEMGEAGEGVLSSVCGLVFNAVCEVIARSHSEMSAGLRGLAAQGNGGEKSTDVMVDKLSRSFVDLSGQKTVRFQDEQQVDNPRAVLADFSRRFHSQTSIPPLRLEAHIQLSIPRIHMEPRLSDIHLHLVQMTSVLLSVLRNLRWWAGPGAGREFHVIWDASGAVDYMHSEILERFKALEPLVDLTISSLRIHDFIWREDMHATYQQFLQTNPTQAECCGHVERFIEVEKTLKAIPAVRAVGPLQLSTLPVTHALTALTLGWKLEFANFLHKQAQTTLKALVDHRESMSRTLQAPVETLEHLRTCLQMLLDINDLRNTIDEQYIPVEKAYGLLRRYTPSLPRSEVTQVDTLREEWDALTQLADTTQHRLLHEQRHIHERETEKQVRGFLVETIRFRNSFDTEGPLVPDLTPHCAMSRLDSFLQQCNDLQRQRDLLCTVQDLLSLPVTTYPELDQTQTDLDHLKLLYSSYQQFLNFDEKFRQTLWQEVNLTEAEGTLERLWSDTSLLPPEQQEWEATRKLRADICHYRDLLPLLAKLHSKEVRNRHWLQVMRVTNCTFQLEGSIFRLSHLLEAPLLQHEEEIGKIVVCAQKELKLENEFRDIEEHWNEQVLRFTPYKSLGSVLLEVSHTHFLCESLESVGAKLAVMLVSRHVTHLRDEVVQCAGQLSRIEEILTQWLDIQEQWRQLEAILTLPSTAQSFKEEAADFESISCSWVELMASASQAPGVIECCDGEVSRVEVLSDLGKRLEHCKQSLSLYLHSKRQAFPRFFYASDDSLLQILSSPFSPSSLTPYLPELFTSIRSLITSSPDNEGDPVIITAVKSVEGEQLDLTEPVQLCDDVEEWLSRLLSSSHQSVRSLLEASISNSSSPSVEEMTREQPCQVASLTIYLNWTRDTEQALSQCRYDRHALPGLRSKFTSSVIGKLTHMLMRGRRKTGEEVTTGEREREREKLEALAMLAVWLRDIVDDLCHQKIRGAADFEWQRFPRLYVPTESPEPSGVDLEYRCLHMKMEYGYEYLGCRSLPVFTPRMNNYMISLFQGMESGLHSMVCGPRNSGKHEMVRGIAHLLGRYLILYPCTPLSSAHTLARIMEGLAQDGGWVCLTDVDSVPQCVMGVVCHMIEAVSTALHSKQSTYITPCGRQALIQPGMVVVVTSSTPSWELPPGVGPLFRTFSLPPLDPFLYLLATCTALGLRGPRQLASKLSTLCHMTRQQLKRELPLRAICGVLRGVHHRSSRLQTVASVPHHKSEGGRSDRGGRRDIGEHGSHRHVTGHSPVKEVHRGQKTISLMTTPPSTQPLPPSSAREHTSLAQLLVILLAPRFDNQEHPVFLEMVRTVFGLDRSTPLLPLLEMGGASQLITTPSSCVTGNDIIDIEAVSVKAAKKTGLVATDPWLTKVKEILLMVQLSKRHIILSGEAATGKTAALRTAASGLTMLTNQKTEVNIHRLYPGAFDDISTLIGRFSETGAWEDGVCVSLFRKGLKTASHETWVCLDGEPASTWIDPIAELFSSNTRQTLCLPSGERVVGVSNCGLRLVLESGNLHTTTPAILHSCGVIHFDSDVLTWQPLVEVWLKSRPGIERTCLKEQFGIFMDPVVRAVCHSSHRGQREAYSEVGLTETCLAYLTSLLKSYAETAESFSSIHVVRLLVFSLIWSFGAVLPPGPERQSFSHLLKSLTNCLPDDDTQYSVFDYYVDESGEWDVWQTRLPVGGGESGTGAVDLLGNVYVDTTDSVRMELLLELALSAKRNVLIAGPRGCGKTTICRHFLQARALSHMTSEAVSQVTLDGHTHSSTLHHFMKVYMHHRQGFTYSPQDRKTLHVFIDDLHLPYNDKTTPPSCHEYIRQLVDSSGVYNIGKRNTFASIEDLTLFTSLTTNTGHTTISPRLKRHFAIVHLPELTGIPLASILTETLWTLWGGIPGTAAGAPFDRDKLTSIVESTEAVFLKVRAALKESDMPGRQHYVFSLSQIESAFQGLYYCLSSTSCCNVAFSWYHEMTRSLADLLCHSSDYDWIVPLIHSHAEKLAGGLPSPLPLSLSAVPLKIKQGEEQPLFTTTPINQLPEVELYPLHNWCDMDISLNLFLMRCRHDWGDFPLSLSTNQIHCIIRLHRSLKFPRGNAILAGPHGQQLHSIAKFSLYLAGYQLRQLDSTSSRTFISSLRGLFRRAGLEGCPVAAILTESDLDSIEVLQTLNSLFSTGELPTLFSNDEMSGILQALAPSIKKEFPSEEVHPMQYLTARITRYLRIIICVPPSSPLLTSLAHSLRGLLSSCHIIWIPGWSELELSRTLTHFFSTTPLAPSLADDIRVPLFNCLSRIHRLVLKQSGHLELAGHSPSSLDPHTTTLDARDEREADSSSLESFPMLMERVINIERELGGHNYSTGFAGEFKLPYVGPLTFLHLLENFCSIYTSKQSAVKKETEMWNKAVQALEKTAEEVSSMEETLSQLEKDYSIVCGECSGLLEQLTDKSCQVERAKALLGAGDSVMNAIQITTEQERAMAEEYEDDDGLLASLLGPTVIRRGSRLEVQLEGARERELVCEAEEKKARMDMVSAKEEVQSYEEKIDRNLIDQIKSLPNPPTVVCTVMQVILQLLHHHGRDTTASGRVGGVISEDSVQSGGQSTATGSQYSGHRQQSTSLPHPLPPPPTSTATSLTDSKEQWTQIKQAIGDSQNFRDLITALHWEEGLTVEAMNLIKAHLNTCGNSNEQTTTDQSTTQKSLVSFSAAKHAADVIAVIFGFAVGLVRYTAVYKDYQLASDRLRRARDHSSELRGLWEAASVGDRLERGGGRAGGATEATELGDLQEEEEGERDQEGLQRLQEELKELQTEFNKSAVKKHSLDQTCSQLAEGLKSTTHLMESLKSRRKTWQNCLSHTPSHQLLLTNCLLAAAVTTYCGPYSTLSRHRLFLAVVDLCKECILSSGDDCSQLLTLEKYPQFMVGEPALHQLTLEGLPTDQSSRQSACMITCNHAHSWPLICDPFGMAVGWVSRRREDTVIVEYESPNLHSTLITALTSGTHLLITGVIGESVCGDDVLVSILQYNQKGQGISNLHKINVGEKEVECSPNFRLVLLTPDLPTTLPCKLVAMTTVVLFWPEVSGIEGLLLDRLLWKQNSKIAQERQQFRKEIYQHCLKAEDTEKELLLLLCHDHHLNDSPPTRELLQVNASYEDAVDSLSKTTSALQRMTEVQLCSLSALASRAALMSSVAMVTGMFLPLYAVSYVHVESVFLSFLEQTASHIQGDEALQRLTHFAYHHFSRGMLDNHRLLFAFTLVLQIELSQGIITHKEISYFLRPVPGTKFAVKGLAAQAGMDLRDATPFSIGKRPYDWILEQQWQGMLMLMSNFPWAQKAIQNSFNEESLGLQAAFRNLFQSKHSELHIITSGKKIEELKQRITHNLIHILLMNTSVRPDRLACCFGVISEAVLMPSKSCYDTPVELGRFYRTCCKERIPLIVFHDEPQLPANQIRALARKLHMPVTVHTVHGTGHREVERVKEIMARVRDEGGWLLLHNIQASPPLVLQLPSLLKTHPASDGWRLWLSVSTTSETSLPVALLNNACRIVLDTPKNLKSSLLYTLHSLNSDLLTASSRVEWLPLLHSCALLYAVLRKRREIHTVSWSSCLPLKYTNLMDVLHYLKTVAGHSEAGPGGGNLPYSWSGIRYMLAEDVILEKLSHHNPSLVFRHFLLRETSQMNTSLHTIHSSLFSLLRALDNQSHGDPHTLTNTPHLAQLSHSLLALTVPRLWQEAVGPTSAPPHWPLKEWIQDLCLRWVFMDQVLSQGLAKVPTYWLGAFFHPEAFLSLLTQNVLQSQCSNTGATEETQFLAEVTSRNKDHIRDPPTEGELFVFGCYMWGCRIERSATIDIQDHPPKQSPTTLPLLHLALSTLPTNEQTTNDPGKGAESKATTIYHCPVFVNHTGRHVGGNKKELFKLLVHNPEVPPSKWSLRTISCTLRPF